MRRLLGSTIMLLHQCLTDTSSVPLLLPGWHKKGAGIAALGTGGYLATGLCSMGQPGALLLRTVQTWPSAVATAACSSCKSGDGCGGCHVSLLHCLLLAGCHRIGCYLAAAVAAGAVAGVVALRSSWNVQCLTGANHWVTQLGA